jgi:hypothetical protein
VREGDQSGESIQKHAFGSYVQTSQSEKNPKFPISSLEGVSEAEAETLSEAGRKFKTEGKAGGISLFDSQAHVEAAQK